ncbi:MAG TPA: methionyl-tRNA formyltransferase [Gemmatimonadaceae bacterium]|nr:methionyl-tRNA formyltransferase [Gemmatimonadaceae bacterium]
MRVLFWGTPEFASAPLRALIGEGYEVTGVVTQPDKPQGRSRKLTPPPVKQIALDEHIPVYQPATLKDEEFIDAIGTMSPDISVVVAYGHILPRRIIDLPRLGTLNIHASLLPQLRGAAPIQAAIKQGFTETGVTIMRMVPALDAGPIILPAATPILEDETYGELQNRLSELGALTLLESLALIELGAATEQAQDDSRATYAPKVTRADAQVNWSLPADDVARTIRAYDPKPGAFTTINGVDVKLFGPRAVPLDGVLQHQVIPEPGDVVSVNDGLVVMCADSALRIQDVQPSGRGRMRSAEWGRGRGVSVGDKCAG